MLEDLEAPLEVPYLQAVPAAVGRKRLGAYRFGARRSLDRETSPSGTTSLVRFSTVVAIAHTRPRATRLTSNHREP